MVDVRFVCLIERQQLLVEQEFHLAHGAFQTVGLELAFPDDDHLPAVVLEELVVLLVPLLVSGDFVDPELGVGLRYLTTTRFSTAHLKPFTSNLHVVPMPKASVDKDGCVVAAHHDVGLPRNAFHVEAVAVAVTPQPLPDLQFGLGVAAADVRHHKMALRWSEVVGHKTMLFLSF